ncbi:MAG: 30S ribosomal protein S27ae [Candidatus Thermoplasmatota archaeon]|nr:30S ribosomal protein S27ae [Candidatus Thermoplasmatota archaeon]
MGDKWRKSKVSKYDMSSGELVRKGEFCPRCGPGVFLAVHADRTSCGRCGYQSGSDEAEAPATSDASEEE